MLQFLIVFLFFLVAIGLMLLSLYFSKYKQNGESCCSDRHCSTVKSSNPNHQCKKDHDKLISKIKVEKL